MLRPHNTRMKKGIMITLVFVLALSFSPLAAANSNEGFEYSVDSRVRMNEDGTAEFDIRVTGLDVYAGAQLELILSDGVSIESVSFDKVSGFSSIPPTYARGSYFFSLIAGTNEYEGDFICTVSILYEGTEPAQITIAEIQTYFIVEPGNIDTTVNNTQTVIEVLPFGYVTIDDSLIPLAWLRQNWIWLVIIAAVIAAVITVIVVHHKKRKKAKNASGKRQASGESDSELITIDKAEYERLIANKDNTVQQPDGNDPV